MWNLRIDSNQFFLQLNASIREPQDITVMAREADFVALVYPAVIRQILSHLLFGSECDSVEPDHDWFQFARLLAGRPPPAKDDDRAEEDFLQESEEWIDAVITAFCEQQHASENFVKCRKEPEIIHHA